jgi:hypothetical protein
MHVLCLSKAFLEFQGKVFPWDDKDFVTCARGNAMNQDLPQLYFLNIFQGSIDQ